MKPVRKECERFKECPQKVTKYHFESICNSQHHQNCFWFGRWKKTNKTPFQWLQQLAIEQARKAGQMPDPLEIRR